MFFQYILYRITPVVTDLDNFFFVMKIIKKSNPFPKRETVYNFVFILYLLKRRNVTFIGTNLIKPLLL
jgi:hypothetical protein